MKLTSILDQTVGNTQAKSFNIKLDVEATGLDNRNGDEHIRPTTDSFRHGRFRVRNTLISMHKMAQYHRVSWANTALIGGAYRLNSLLNFVQGGPTDVHGMSVKGDACFGVWPKQNQLITDIF